MPLIGTCQNQFPVKGLALLPVRETRERSLVHSACGPELLSVFLHPFITVTGSKNLTPPGSATERAPHGPEWVLLPNTPHGQQARKVRVTFFWGATCTWRIVVHARTAPVCQPLKSDERDPREREAQDWLYAQIP